MPITLNASTSSGLVVTPDNSGNIVLQYNGVSTPAFSAYLNQAQTPSVAWTKVQMNGELFDTASCYDTTNYRFTPTVAGYYQFNLTVYQGQALIEMQPAIYKNGAGGNGVYGPDTASTYGVTVSTIMYMNGTTDYVEPYIYLYSSRALTANSSSTFFTGCLLRGA
jgi:hypothetical protein